MSAGTGDYPPIETYAFLSDTHTAALLAPDGAVEWMCAPRFDAASVFARLLDRNRGGALELEVAGAPEPERRYLDGTLVLESRFTSSAGTTLVHDFLALGASEGEDPAGLHPRHLLVRLVSCVSGEAQVRLRADARPDYGRAEPRWWSDAAGYSLEAPGCRLTLTSDAQLELDGGAPVCEATLRAGERLALGLAYIDGTGHRIDADYAEALLEQRCV